MGAKEMAHKKLPLMANLVAGTVRCVVIGVRFGGAEYEKASSTD
jgi:hypothetical protein